MPRLACLTAVLAAVAFASSASGQDLTLTPRPDAEAGLPPSIRAFDVTREGTSLQAFLLRADPSADDWVMEAVASDQGGETVSSFASDNGVYAAINGGYYGGGQSYSLILNDDVLLAPNIKAINRSGTTFFPTRSAFSLTYDGTPDVGWVYDVEGSTYVYPTPSPNAPGTPQPQPTASFPEGGRPLTSVQAAIGGGPVLVQEGAVAITYDEEVFFGGSGVDLTSRRARTAVGYTDGDDARILLVAVRESDGLTLAELGQLMVDLGAVEALNLDGGGSSSMVSGGVSLVSSARPVFSSLRLRDPSAIGPEQGVTFDTGDATYRETGGWFESANTPFAAGTPSRLNEVGTGEDRAVFQFDGIQPGFYQIEAWWTASSNRASNTPYTIYQGGIATVQRVDQSPASTSGSWNPLGLFELAPGDSVVVTDDAAARGSVTTYVSVDAIRLVATTAQSGDDGPDPADALHVAPNPAADRLVVSVTTAGPVAIELVDTLGRTVRRQEVVGRGEASVTLDVRALPAAVYLVRVTGETEARRTRGP